MYNDFMINRYQISSVSFIEIITKNLKVTLCDFGASIYSIYFDDTLMTQTLVNEKDFLNSGVYHGKTIGRTANRIKGTSIYINNKEYIFFLSQDSLYLIHLTNLEQLKDRQLFFQIYH